MNLIVNAYPKQDARPLGVSLAEYLSKHLGSQTQMIRIYEAGQKYFDYEHNQEWIDSLVKSETIIVPVPVWNFMVPAALKDFFDKVLKRGKLWDMDKEGNFLGLLKDRPVYIIMTSGGNYPAGSSRDFIIPYLRATFEFMGIKNIKEFRIGQVSGGQKLTDDKQYFAEKAGQMLKAFGL